MHPFFCDVFNVELEKVLQTPQIPVHAKDGHKELAKEALVELTGQEFPKSNPAEDQRPRKTKPTKVGPDSNPTPPPPQTRIDQPPTKKTTPAKGNLPSIPTPTINRWISFDSVNSNVKSHTDSKGQGRPENNEKSG